MKSSAFLLCLCLLAGCSSTTSQETTSQDTVTVAVAALDTATIDVAPEQSFKVTDSAAMMLKAHVDSLFAVVYEKLSDPDNYYKVVYEDYYDEYEGQDQMERNTWYFDKEYNLVYSTFSYQNGAMYTPDSTEYLSKGAAVIAVKSQGEYRNGGSDDISYTVWSEKTSGLVVNWSNYFKKPDTIQPLPKDFVENEQKKWELYLSFLRSTIEAEDEVMDDDDIYVILKETPKQSELTDYTKLVIPRQMYNQFRPDR